MVKAIMLDWETLAATPDAIVISIGAVSFDPYAKDFYCDKFYRRIHLAGQDNRRVDQKTLWWWIDKQSRDAQAVFNPEGAASLPTAIIAFNAFSSGATELWGNGADFDNPIYNHIIAELGYTSPFPYNAARCFRTLKNLYPYVKVEFQGTQHNAVDDAAHQARWCWEIMKVHKARNGEA